MRIAQPNGNRSLCVNIAETTNQEPLESRKCVFVSTCAEYTETAVIFAFPLSLSPHQHFLCSKRNACLTGYCRSAIHSQQGFLKGILNLASSRLRLVSDAFILFRICSYNHKQHRPTANHLGNYDCGKRLIRQPLHDSSFKGFMNLRESTNALLLFPAKDMNVFLSNIIDCIIHRNSFFAAFAKP